MNIQNCNKLMTNGVACKKDVEIEFPINQYLRNANFLILIAREGMLRLEVNFKKYELKHDMIVTIVPESTVRYIYASNNFKGSFLTFEHNFAVDIIPRPEPSYMDFIRNYPIGVIPQDRIEAAHALIGNIQYFIYHNNGDHRFVIAKNYAQNIIFEISDEIKSQFMQNKPKVFSRQKELFMKFIHLVYEFGDKNREVGFYANKLCITTRYLASIVRNIAHETAKDIIDRHCVQEIKTLLLTSNQSIQSIAIELEFPDQSFFTRYFKKLTGMTPTDFRTKPQYLH